jgi:MFS family permease
MLNLQRESRDPMYDPTNPYASPQRSSIDPVAAHWLGDRSASLMKVAMGLRLVYLGVIVVVGAVVVGGVVGFIIGASAGSAENARAAIVRNASIFFVIALAGIGGRILNLVGSLFCMATPPETRAQGYISASVGTMIGALAIQIGNVLGIVQDVLQPVNVILMAVSAITFVLFLRRMADFMGRRDLMARAKSVMAWLIALIALVGVIFGLSLFATTMVNRDQALGILGLIGIVSLGTLIVGLVTAVQLTSLVAAIRRVILSGSPV